MRNFRQDPSAGPGWIATWDIDDRYGCLADGAQAHLRYTDLTVGAAAAVADSWVIEGGYSSTKEAWIPRIMVRRSGEEPLASCFVGIIEPYTERAAIRRITRFPLTVGGQEMPEGNVALRIDLADGRSDLLVALDAENPLGLSPSAAGGAVEVPAWGLTTDAELCLVRLDAAGRVEHVSIARGSAARVQDVDQRSDGKRDLIEWTREDGGGK